MFCIASRYVTNCILPPFLFLHKRIIINCQTTKIPLNCILTKLYKIQLQKASEDHLGTREEVMFYNSDMHPSWTGLRKRHALWPLSAALADPATNGESAVMEALRALHFL